MQRQAKIVKVSDLVNIVGTAKYGPPELPKCLFDVMDMTLFMGSDDKLPSAQHLETSFFRVLNLSNKIVRIRQKDLRRKVNKQKLAAAINDYQLARNTLFAIFDRVGKVRAKQNV